MNFEEILISKTNIGDRGWATDPTGCLDFRH